MLMQSINPRCLASMASNILPHYKLLHLPNCYGQHLWLTEIEKFEEKKEFERFLYWTVHKSRPFCMKICRPHLHCPHFSYTL